jgi:hypothetical protein
LTSGGGLDGTVLGGTGGGEKQTSQDGPNLTQNVQNASTDPIAVAHQGHTHANQRVNQPTIIGNYAICL